MTRRRMIANGVDRLSSKTKVVDCHGILGDYLRSIGKRGTIGDTPVYVVRGSNRVVGVGTSEPEAIADAAKRGGGARA